MKRENKTKMNGVIYYLLTSFTAKRKNKAMKSTKQNAVKADYHWLAIPICAASKTVHYSAQHFLNFRQTTSLPPSQPSLATKKIWDILIENQNNNKYSSSKYTPRGWSLGVAWSTGHAPTLTEIIRNGRRNTTTNHYYKNTNVIMIVFCCLILIFFW